ncbi:hypothetical protein [Tenacibaculum sp. A30]|uniref:hypothetical protein n=1 Tax=Tenacibaculum sp. A30 TaxID=3442644 RepID=UPI003EB82B04
MKNTFPTKVKISPLEEVLKYENKNVIDRFMNYFSTSKDEANIIFNETKKWLWLCAKSFEDKTSIYINNDLLIIDEMWHTFIIFTLDYELFCKKYFNTLIHHVPTVKNEIPENFSKKEKILFLKNREDQFFNYVYDNLGNETTNLWFLEIPQKYSKQNINRLFKGIYPEK